MFWIGHHSDILGFSICLDIWYCSIYYIFGQDVAILCLFLSICLVFWPFSARCVEKDSLIRWKWMRKWIAWCLSDWRSQRLAGITPIDSLGALQFTHRNCRWTRVSGNSLGRDGSNVQGGGANAFPQNFISMYKFYCRKKLILVSSLNAPPQALRISPYVFLPLLWSFSRSVPVARCTSNDSPECYDAP